MLKEKEKDDAKIEGAVQIAIGVKKEVDFATWYTNVCAYIQLSPVQLAQFTSLFPGPAQGGHARLLQRQRLLHSQALVVQHLGDHPRYAHSVSAYELKTEDTRLVQRSHQGARSTKCVLPHVRLGEGAGA